MLTDRSLRLDAEPTSARRARHFVAGVLNELERDDLVDTAQLVVSEVVTNAVLHAHSGIELRVEGVDDGVRIEVRDGNATVPAPRSYGTEATTGRGLALVAALAAEFGVSPQGGDGKAVWFTLRTSVGADVEPEFDAEAWTTGWDLEGLLPDDGAALDAPTTTCVQLRQLPVALWLAAQQHHDAVLRELVLHRAEHEPEAGEKRADTAAAEEAQALLAVAVERELGRALQRGVPLEALPEGHPSPLPRTPAALDVELSVTAAHRGSFGALQDALDEAERLAAADRLLVRPALPEVVAVRDWCCEQAVAQSEGVPAAPWGGSDQAHFVDSARDRGRTSTPQWDDEAVRTSDRCVLAADDNNRLVAVSAPAAALLGWDVDELTGRRVVVLIPPRLREAHVAAFTRHLTTGEAHVLGVPLDLPVLHADGHEITCRFLVERAPAHAGRSVYLAWLTPLDLTSETRRSGAADQTPAPASS